MSRTAAAARLLAWYDANARQLPWRRSADPYAVWVSEVMLQQTRAETAGPYYQRFLERFPDVESLAAADEEQVLAAWSGLGYYQRARRLHAAARTLVAAGAGWPHTAAEWLRLPGVGRYTAAAVASIAFGEAVPAVDGNVVRVVTRLLGERREVHRAAVARRIETYAAELVGGAEGRPGDVNQALMELGATVCLPRRPRCPSCPLAAGCGALAAGLEQRLPSRRRSPEPRRERRIAALARQGGRLLLVRRPPTEQLLAGLWELPWVAAGEPAEAERALAARYGGRWRLAAPLATLRHAITNRRLEVELWRAELRAAGGVAESAEAGWFGDTALSEMPLAGLARKALAAARRARPDEDR